MDNMVKVVALKALIRSDGTEAEKRLAEKLFDDQVQLLSTFEMNQIASLTYESETCEQIFDVLLEVLRYPLEFGVLAVQKTLFVTQHVLIYGSEKCVNSCWGLVSHIEPLCEFNTVLWAQRQNSVQSWWQNIKGGGVDKGFPVREAATSLMTVLRDPPRIQQLRHDHADPNSLVPVGSHDKVAFVSDEVRFQILQRRVEDYKLLHTKSNLVSARGGFGSGYNSKDGQMVVGAAHSMEEMLALAEREKKKFTEDGPVYYKPRPPGPASSSSAPAAAPVVDLLDFSISTPAPAPAIPTVDLLGFSSDFAPASAPSVDFFAPSPISNNTPKPDFFGDSTLEQPTNTEQVKDTSDLLSLMTLAAPTTVNSSISSTGVNGIGGDYLSTMTRSGAGTATSSLSSFAGIQSSPNSGNGLSTLTLSAAGTPSSSIASGGLGTKSPIMVSNEDRFAALDALSHPEAEVNKVVATMASIEAEQRILNFQSSVAVSDVTIDIPSSIAAEGQPPLPTESPHLAFLGGEGNSTGVVPMGGGSFMGDVAPMGGESFMEVQPMGGGTFASGSLMGGAGIMNGAPIGGFVTSFTPGFGVDAGLAPPSFIPVPPPSDPPMPPPSSPPPLPPSSPPPLPPSSPPPPIPPTYNAAAIGMAERFGDLEDDGGFVMGGSVGAGL